MLDSAFEFNYSRLPRGDNRVSCYFGKHFGAVELGHKLPESEKTSFGKHSRAVVAGTVGRFTARSTASELLRRGGIF